MSKNFELMRSAGVEVQPLSRGYNTRVAKSGRHTNKKLAVVSNFRGGGDYHYCCCYLQHESRL